MKETLPLSLPLILEMEEPFRLTPQELDNYWANGWDRDAEYVFRQNITLLHGEVCSVVPLRIPLSGYQPTKSQRKVLKKCADFQIEIKPIELSPTKEDMYRKHRVRFQEYVRNSLSDFFFRYTGKSNFPTWEISIYHQEKLIGASFFDVGEESIYSIYGMFDPEYSSYSLGKCTMLLELEFCLKTGKKYYYPGHAVDVPSFYDYKKKFNEVEFYNWRGHWKPIKYLPKELTFNRLVRKKLNQITELAKSEPSLSFQLNINKEFFGQAWDIHLHQQQKIQSPLFLYHRDGMNNYTIEYRAEQGYYHLAAFDGVRPLFSGNDPNKLLQVLLLEKEKVNLFRAKLQAQVKEIETYLLRIPGMEERLFDIWKINKPSSNNLILFCQGDKYGYFVFQEPSDKSFLISKKLKDNRLKLISRSTSAYEVALVLQVAIEREQQKFRQIKDLFAHRKWQSQYVFHSDEFYSVSRLIFSSAGGVRCSLRFSIPDQVFVLENLNSSQLYFIEDSSAENVVIEISSRLNF